MFFRNSSFNYRAGYLIRSGIFVVIVGLTLGFVKALLIKLFLTPVGTVLFGIFGIGSLIFSILFLNDLLKKPAYGTAVGCLIFFLLGVGAEWTVLSDFMGQSRPAGAKIWISQLAQNGSSHVIHIQGKIVKGDADRFEDVVRSAGVKPGKPTTVHLEGPGGIVQDGMRIAYIVKKNGWVTWVPDNVACTSMCANIWLAGGIRWLEPEAKIGFHSLSDARLPGVRDEKANSMALDFYRDMGVSMKAARVFLAADPSDILWLSPDLANSLDISTVTLP